MDNYQFSNTLIVWYEVNKRSLPWRETADPYTIWISEIILQQTRVDQALGYYSRFLDLFPNVKILSEASEQEVLKVWEGLGYYSRARNIHFAAKQVMNDFKGAFPDTYENILKLKGVGEYTAGAIASFAYNLPYPAVDGNVFRVISRIFGMDVPIDTSAGKNSITDWVRYLQDAKQPATFNQALIEFGALQCVPRSPHCEQCPFEVECVARSSNSIELLPVKQGKTTVKPLYIYYFVIEQNKRWIVEQRKGAGIWRNLYQFPMLEMPNKISIEEAVSLFFDCSVDLLKVSEPVFHKLSHRSIEAYFIDVNVSPEVFARFPMSVNKAEMEDLPFPVIMNKYVGM